MNLIASFCINHDILVPGIYVSRVDGDITTYDIRMRRPNKPPYLENSVLHTMEHLFATFARNSEFKDDIIYFGPMGCRTGFYFLVRNMDKKKVIHLITSIFQQLTEFEGTIPGTTSRECGNYLEHDLAGAKKEARNFLPTIETWTEEDLKYPEI